MNGRSLSRSILPPPGRLAVQMDGGFRIDMIDVSIKTYGTGRQADGQKAQSFQSTTSAGWRRFSLAVRFTSRFQAPIAQIAPMDAGPSDVSRFTVRRRAGAPGDYLAHRTQRGYRGSGTIAPLEDVLIGPMIGGPTVVLVSAMAWCA